MAKGRESGMPDRDHWGTFFNPTCIVSRLDCAGSFDVIEFGCGYGLFTVPAAKVVTGTVYSLDIEPEMVAATAELVARSGVLNVRVEQRDFLADGCGRPDASAGYAMHFNILHVEDPVALLREVYRARPARSGRRHPLEARPVNAPRAVSLHPPDARTVPRLGRIERFPLHPRRGPLLLLLALGDGARAAGRITAPVRLISIYRFCR